jgi:hypothetical protein
MVASWYTICLVEFGFAVILRIPEHLADNRIIFFKINIGIDSISSRSLTLKFLFLRIQ